MTVGNCETDLGTKLVSAVGQLQFEVVAHRLKHEYGCEARMSPARYVAARWVTCEDDRELKRFIDANAHRVAHDAVGAPAFLAGNSIEIDVAQEQWPKIKFHGLCEHAGLIFHSNAAVG